MFPDASSVQRGVLQRARDVPNVRKAIGTSLSSSNDDSLRVSVHNQVGLVCDQDYLPTALGTSIMNWKPKSPFRILSAHVARTRAGVHRQHPEALRTSLSIRVIGPPRLYSSRNASINQACGTLIGAGGWLLRPRADCLISCRARGRRDVLRIACTMQNLWRIRMKAFLLACVAAVVIAAASAAMLSGIQKPVAQAFATTGVRL